MADCYCAGLKPRQQPAESQAASDACLHVIMVPEQQVSHPRKPSLRPFQQRAQSRAAMVLALKQEGVVELQFRA